MSQLENEESYQFRPISLILMHRRHVAENIE